MKRRPTAAALLIAAAAIPATMSAAGAASSWSRCERGPRITCVVDGDTFWFGRVKYRLTDADAPEAGDNAQCDRERALADHATGFLQELLAAPQLRIEPTGKDRYGRVLVRVTTAQGGVAENLIASGLARPYRGGYRDRQQWCRNP